MTNKTLSVPKLQVLGRKVDQSTISKIEQGIRSGLDFQVVALGKAFKESAAWLLEEANKQNIPQ